MADIDVIIVGYGSAGKRHEKAARARGLSVVTVDPDHTRKALMFDYEHAFRAYSPKMVVVATPPDGHLEVVNYALELTPYVLCEKPLCDVGEIEDAQRVIDKHPDQKVNVAYNYRYHAALKGVLEDDGEIKSLTMTCVQHRLVRPSWGYLLDHVSHDLDIVRMFLGDNIVVHEAERHMNIDSESIIVSGARGDTGVYIRDCVYNSAVDRSAIIYTVHDDFGEFIDVFADPQMYEIMWDRFLEAYNTKSDIDISMSDALITQKLIDDVYGGIYNVSSE